jgi:hypothetical protein
LQLFINDSFGRRTHAFDTFRCTIISRRQCALGFGFHLLQIRRPFKFQRLRGNRSRGWLRYSSRLLRNRDRFLGYRRCSNNRRFHNNSGCHGFNRRFRDRRWRLNCRGFLRYQRCGCLHGFMDNLLNRCRYNREGVGHNTIRFRIWHKRRARVPDTVAALLLALTFLALLGLLTRALATIRTATTTTPAATAAAFFAVLLLGTLRKR